jgi:hypothetical protein
MSLKINKNNYLLSIKNINNSITIEKHWLYRGGEKNVKFEKWQTCNHYEM